MLQSELPVLDEVAEEYYKPYIRAKIHQQLQVLRDAGYLEFTGHGKYRTK
ncbi:MAG: hypothetical protein ACYDCJ_12185 [Gammaproteobacteria bacterium]